MNYEVTLRVKTNKDPEELVDVLRKLFREDALTIDSYHWTKIEPSGWKAPSLIGRKFIWGKYDCWSIVTDWLKENKNIDKNEIS